MTGEAASGSEWVWLARIRRVQGRKGEVVADLLTDFPEKFKDRKWVWLLRESGDGVAAPGAEASVAREIELVHSWLPKGGHAGDVVLHFGGVDSIDDAEKLKGMVVAISRAERTELGEDEAYIGDLIGCVLVDVATGPVGVIEGVDRDAGPVALLVVRAESGQEGGREGGHEVLVPFAKAYLRRIDLEGRRVEMALPEGLVEAQVT